MTDTQPILRVDTAARPGPSRAGSVSGSSNGAGTAYGPAGLVLAVSAALTLVLVAFAWPATHLAPRHVPLVVVAPPPAVTALEQQLAASAGEDAFDLTPVPDRAAAERAVKGREAYGALVLRDGGELLTAGAAGPAVATMLSALAAAVPAQAGGPLAVTDLVPLPTSDPRGTGLGSSLLPLVIGGITSGAIAALALRGRRRQVGTALAIAVVTGGALSAVLQIWLGVLGGSYWANAGAMVLGIAAVGVVVVGLSSAFGRVGLTLASATIMLLGNPLSGITSAPELLPAPWGAIGQWLPPGASGSLLRSTGYFDGAGAAGPLLVLAGWVLAGLALTLIPRRATPEGHSQDPSQEVGR